MYQRTTVVGRLGKDPESKYTPGGTEISRFSLASGDKYTDKRTNELVETVMWWQVSTFGKLAEFCNRRLKKGAMVLIEGVLKGDERGNPRIWTATDGSPRAQFELTGNIVRVLVWPERVEEKEEEIDGPPAF